MEQKLRHYWLATFLLLTVARLTPASPALTTFYVFGPAPGTNGYSPYAGMARGSDGNYYGTAYLGGAAFKGTIFRITPTGVISNLHSFSGTFGSGDGSNPYAPLLLGKDGNFYGTTIGGGSGGNGTVFRISPSGAFTNLFSFTSGQGSQPYGGLLQGSDGNLYGTTYGGAGSVFRISTNGTSFTTMHSFAGADGFGPMAGLVQGSDGNFYGTTEKGGTNGWNIGTVFSITSAGSFTHLHSFSGPDGSTPVASLVAGIDGNLYGTTRLGGIPSGSSVGTVFRISSAGAFATIYSFTNCVASSCAPYGALMQASDGNFYGTTASGGVSTNNCNCGTIFRLSPGGDLTLLYSFSSADGSTPYGTLVEDSNSNLYGTCELGGSPDYGTVFKLTGAVIRLPKLQSIHTTGAITLLWPTNFSGFSAQANPALTNTATWSNVIGSPLVTGTNYSITLPTTNAIRYFRLSSP